MANDDDIARLAVSIRRGSIVAAAGCGKTEQIALAVGSSDGRRLILTHTHAGVDALTRRLRKHHVPTAKYRIDTIAGWCLRFAASFPQRSGFSGVVPTTSAHWDSVYHAGARLLDSGAVDGVLLASYRGCFVDEYQDCTKQQHQVVSRLANLLPTCVFGDPLQAIFDFGDQQPVDWDSDVFPLFERSAELLTPWRWKNAENLELAEWLQGVRTALENSNYLDLQSRPRCVTWTSLPAAAQRRQRVIVGECLASMRDPVQGSLIVIGDSTSENRRSALAQKLAKQGFGSLEAKLQDPLRRRQDDRPDDRVGPSKGNRGLRVQMPDGPRKGGASQSARSPPAGSAPGTGQVRFAIPTQRRRDLQRFGSEYSRPSANAPRQTRRLSVSS
ncbi:UvrD-helicase domain-containing protein [Bradyrhizobium sp. DASA03076]|uniref:UvrD-helicase domain-containing protein n=1 Tax=Bradyrhizobium sp. BLXBL-03 TaxID=3395916 RepID=UPI003F7131F5